MKTINVLGYQYRNAFIFYTNPKLNIENEEAKFRSIIDQINFAFFYVRKLEE